MHTNIWFIMFYFVSVFCGLLAICAPVTFSQLTTVPPFLKRVNRRDDYAIAVFCATRVAVCSSFGIFLSVYLWSLYNPSVAYWTPNIQNVPIYQGLARDSLFILQTVCLILGAGSAFRVIKIGIPAWLTSTLIGRASRSGGLIGIFFLAIGSTLLCLEEIVPSLCLLGCFAVSGPWYWPAVGLTVFSLIFVSPYLADNLRELFLCHRWNVWYGRVIAGIGTGMLIGFFWLLYGKIEQNHTKLATGVNSTSAEVLWRV